MTNRRSDRGATGSRRPLRTAAPRRRFGDFSVTSSLIANELQEASALMSTHLANAMRHRKQRPDLGASGVRAYSLPASPRRSSHVTIPARELEFRVRSAHRGFAY